MWPRNWYAGLVKRASNGGASVIGLDLLLSEEGGTSVEDKLWGQQLADAIGNAGNVVIARKSAGGGYEAIEPFARLCKCGLGSRAG